MNETEKSVEQLCQEHRTEFQRRVKEIEDRKCREPEFRKDVESSIKLHKWRGKFRRWLLGSPLFDQFTKDYFDRFSRKTIYQFLIAQEHLLLLEGPGYDLYPDELVKRIAAQLKEYESVGDRDPYDVE